MPSTDRPTDDFSLRDAYPELGRLLTGRPPVAPAWRDFWKVWIPAFLVMGAALAVVGGDLTSLEGIGVLLGGMVFTVLLGRVMRRLGWVGPSRTAPRRTPPPRS